MITYKVCLCPTHPSPEKKKLTKKKKRKRKQDIWIFEVWLVQAPVIQTSDSAIHRINRYPVDNIIHLLNNLALVLTSQAKNGVQMPLLIVTGPFMVWFICKLTARQDRSQYNEQITLFSNKTCSTRLQELQ